MSVPDKKDGKKLRKSLWATAVLWGAVLAAGCTAGSFAGTGEETAAAGPTGTAGTAVSTETIAAEDGIPGRWTRTEPWNWLFKMQAYRRGDAYNIKVESDRENDISIYQVEFETDYGDYDFEIAVTGGAIVGADYEVVNNGWMHWEEIQWIWTEPELWFRVRCRVPLLRKFSCGRRTETAESVMRVSFTLAV